MDKKISLSDGEWKLMNCMWEASPRTITGFVAALKEETGWTKHTVISMLSRMEAKGAIYHEEGERAKQFYPAVQRKDVIFAETHNFLSRFYKGRIGLMLSAMIDQKALSREDINELYAILNEAEEKEV